MRSTVDLARRYPLHSSRVVKALFCCMHNNLLVSCILAVLLHRCSCVQLLHRLYSFAASLGSHNLAALSSHSLRVEENKTILQSLFKLI